MKIKTVLILFSLSLVIAMSLQSQTITNTLFNSPTVLAPAQAQAITNREGQVIPPADVAYFRTQGYTDAEIVAYAKPPQPQKATLSPAPVPAQRQIVTDSQGHVIPPEDLNYFRKLGYTDAEISTSYRPPQPQKANVAVAATPTPPDLKGAMVWMDSFLGTTNAVIAADVISMKPEALKFQLFGKHWNYSGHYTVMLNTPRQHKNPYFGFGSPETANLVILENVGGDTFPLQNATIWEKSNGFIDAVAMDKEWIHSGTYTIQN